MSVYVKQSGAWEETDALYVKQSGSWTTIKEVYVKESGNWRKAAPDTGNYSQTSAGSGSFVVPAMVTEINITSIVAAGGGGSAVWFCGDGFPGGGGGSGGFQTSQTLAVVPGETVNVTVGAGGAPSSFVVCSTTSRYGLPGGDSTITTSAGSITVTGGAGGIYGQPGTGGAGGSPGGTSGSTGVMPYYGGAGGTNGTGYGSGGRGGNITSPDSSKGGLPGGSGAIFVTWGT